MKSELGGGGGGSFFFGLVKGFDCLGGHLDQFALWNIQPTDDPKVWWVVFQAKNKEAKQASAYGSRVGLKVKWPVRSWVATCRAATGCVKPC